MDKTLVAAAALTGLVAASPAAKAQQGRVSADYHVTFIGLSIGEGQMISETDGVAYTTTLRARVTGVAALFAGGHGTAVATGRVVGDRTLANSFRAEINSRGNVETTTIALNAGQVRSVVHTPEKPAHPLVTPVPAGELANVLDPLSSGIFIAVGDGPVTGPAACQRRARVYNGRERFDLVYSFVATRQVEIANYKGPAAVCSVRFEPIAGYRSDRQDIETARERRAEVTLVPITGLRTLLPARISLQTGFGTGTATATNLQLDPGLPVARQTRRAAAD